MGVFSGIVVYLLTWWVVIFAILPLGNTPIEEGGADGFAGAPQVANIKKKFIIASIVSFVIWGIIFALIEIGLIDFREIARQMAQS